MKNRYKYIGDIYIYLYPIVGIFKIKTPPNGGVPIKKLVLVLVTPQILLVIEYFIFDIFSFQQLQDRIFI